MIASGPAPLCLVKYIYFNASSFNCHGLCITGDSEAYLSKTPLCWLVDLENWSKCIYLLMCFFALKCWKMCDLCDCLGNICEQNVFKNKRICSFYKTRYLLSIYVLWLLPIVESDQYGPVELVLWAVGLRSAGVDERVNGCQNEALLVEFLQLTRQLPHRRETQRGRPTWETPNREGTCMRLLYNNNLRIHISSYFVGFIWTQFCCSAQMDVSFLPWTFWKKFWWKFTAPFSCQTDEAEQLVWISVFEIIVFCIACLSAMVVVGVHMDNALILLFILNKSLLSLQSSNFC